MVSIVMEVDAVAADDGPDLSALGMPLDLVLQISGAEVALTWSPSSWRWRLMPWLRRMARTLVF